MSWLKRILNTLRPSRVEHDIDRELAFHLAERVDQLQAEGLTPDEARRRAARQFGNVLVQSERTRDMDVSVALDARVRDVRYALRSLRRTPGFALTAVLTLALGIGANASVFSAIDAILLQPLPFPDGHQLVHLRQARPDSPAPQVAPVRLEDWHRLNDTFETMTGYYMEDVSETSGDVPERVRRASVAPRFLDVWRIAPALGRGFTEGEHRQGSARAVLVSHRYWQRRLGGDANVLNRTVRIGDASHAIVGVMPASFRFPDRDVDLWFPIAIDYPATQSRRNTWYTVIGRLKPHTTIEAARANLQAVQAQLAQQFPDTDRDLTVVITPLKDLTVSGARASLWLLFGAVSVLLLITCVNIAALLLSRAAHRQHEVTLRLSLGASRSAVVAQCLTETLVLALAGGAMGIAVAAAAGAVLRGAATGLPRADEIAVNGRVLIYTLGVSVLVAVACAVLPAIRAGRDGLVNGLKASARTQVAGRHSLQWTLVATQVALSVTLLIGAGLLIRSVDELSRVDAGFDPARVAAFRVSGHFGETMDYERLTRRIDTTIEALLSVPGVERAATTMALPGIPSEFAVTVTLAEADAGAAAAISVDRRVVSPEYFATMGIPLVDGELCRRTSTGAASEVMINRAFAARHLSSWPSPIGLHFNNTSGNAPPGRIVGVVGNAREQGLDREPQPAIYRCQSTPGPTPYFLVRTAAATPAALAQDIRLKIKELEPLRAVYDFAPLPERIDEAFAQNRLRTLLLAGFAAAAVTLAGIGLYGTLGYIVGLRRREIGLRFALGAARGAIARQFLGQVMVVVAIGCVAGLALSMAFARSLSGMLYGVTPADPLTILTVLLAVLLIGALAAAGPAARAAFFDPMQMLREE